MDLSRIYTKTSRGILDGALKTRVLGREHTRLLALIDGKSSIGDLLAQNTRLSENRLAAIIDQLADAGLIRLMTNAAHADDLGFSSTIIVSEADTQAFFDAQIAVENEMRRAEDEEALALDQAREILLKEVTADITAEAEVLKRQEAEQQAQEAAHVEKPPRTQSSNPALPTNVKPQASAKATAHAKAAEAESNARAARAKKAEQEQQEAQTKARAEADRVARAEAKRQANAAALAQETAARAAKAEKERIAKKSIAQERLQLEAKILAEEDAQRNADLDAHLRAIEGPSMAAPKEEIALPKDLDHSRIAAELEARVKRRVEARAREEAQARAEEAAQRQAAEETQRQAEAAAAKLAAEQKAQAEAEARAKAEAQRRAEEAAQRQAAEETQRQAEAAAAKLAAEQKAQAEAEARAKAEAQARAEEAQRQAAEEAQRQAEAAEAAAKLAAEHKARVEAERKAQAEADAEATRRQAEQALVEQQRAQAEAMQKAQEEADARALVAAAEEAVRQESAAAKQRIEEQRREDEARREQAARLLAETTTRALAEERARMESAAATREQEQVRAREAANAKARAEMEDALRREEEALEQEKNEEMRLREAAQERALAAANTATLSLFAQRKPKTWRFKRMRKKTIAVTVAAVLVVGVAVAHLLPFNFYIPKLERQLADSLGQPVTIQTLHFSIYPAPHLALDGVVMGAKAEVRIERANLFPTLNSWFSDEKLMRRVELESVILSSDSWNAFSLWSRQQARIVPFQFERLLVKSGKFNHPFLDAFTFDAEMNARHGRFVQAQIMSTDQRIGINLAAQGDALRIEGKAKQFVLPFEPRLSFDTLKVIAVARAGTLAISNIEAQLFDGYMAGTARVNWTKPWTFNAELGLQQIALEPSLAHFTREAKLTGILEAKVRLAGQAETLNALFKSPQVQATFLIKNGDYSGIDLVRAIQAPSRGGHVGGKTHFNDLSGFFQLSKGRFLYRQIKLQDGAVSAIGNLEVSREKNLSGNLFAELHTPSSRFRSSFLFAGDLQAPVLKVPVTRAVIPAAKPETSTESPADAGTIQKTN